MKRRRPRFKAKRSITPLKSKYLVFTKGRIAKIFFYLGLTVFLIWLFFGELFSIQKIACSQDGDVCKEQINAELSRQIGNSILTFKDNTLEDKLKKADPSISEVKILTHLPNSLEIKLRSRQPEVAIRTSGSKQALLADEEGYIFAVEDVENGGLAEIVTQREFNVTIGSRIEDPLLLSAVELAKILREHFIVYSKMQITDNHFTVKLNEQTQAVFSGESDFVKQVTSLQQILAQATIGSKPTKIDVRFTKPIVSYE